MEGEHLHHSYPDPLIEFISRSTYDAVTGFVREHAPKGGRVLDVGCGRGEILEKLAAAGYEVSGCDSDPWCVQSGGRYGDTMRLSVEEVAPEVVGKFDCVVLSHVLEHVEEPRRAILACASVAPLLVIAVPNPHYSPFILRSLIRSPIENVVHPRHLYSWDYWHLKTFLEKTCGLFVEGWANDSVALPLPRVGRMLASRFGVLPALEGKALPALLPRFCRSLIALVRV